MYIQEYHWSSFQGIMSALFASDIEHWTSLSTHQIKQVSILNSLFVIPHDRIIKPGITQYPPPTFHFYVINITENT